MEFPSCVALFCICSMVIHCSTEPVWCPRGQFYNISTLKCNYCREKCEPGEIRLRGCSTFEDIHCVEENQLFQYFSEIWQFRNSSAPNKPPIHIYFKPGFGVSDVAEQASPPNQGQNNEQDLVRDDCYILIGGSALLFLPLIGILGLLLCCTRRVMYMKPKANLGRDATAVTLGPTMFTSRDDSQNAEPRYVPDPTVHCNKTGAISK